jgi:hypothetical protein
MTRGALGGGLLFATVQICGFGTNFAGFGEVAAVDYFESFFLLGVCHSRCPCRSIWI